MAKLKIKDGEGPSGPEVRFLRSLHPADRRVEIGEKTRTRYEFTRGGITPVDARDAPGLRRKRMQVGGGCCGAPPISFLPIYEEVV